MKVTLDLTKLLEEGKITREEPEEFFNNPRHERTKLFLSQILH